MDELPLLPRSRKNGWMLVYAFFGILAVAGLVLSLLYRDSTKPGEIIRKEQRKNATRVVYTIVFSSVPPDVAQLIIKSIETDVIADSSRTDLIIGSTVTDPWCASLGEYKRNLYKAMTETKEIAIGKQSTIVSMVGGLLTKNELPARIYLVGSLTGDDVSSITYRTVRTVAALELRHNIMGSVEVVSYLTPMNSTVNQKYIKLFTDKGFPVIIPDL